MANIRALLCACAVGVVLISGCGSSDTPAPVAPKTTTEHGSYAECLAEHGVDTPPAPALGPAPGPAAAPPGVEDTAWQQAVRACTELAPGPAGS